MNEGISFYAILITSVFILVVALVSLLTWLFTKNELATEKVDDENDFNHRTGWEMDDQMKIRDLNFKVTCLQNGLRIEKGQALVAYKENQDLKIEVDRLKTKLAEVTQWVT